MGKKKKGSVLAGWNYSLSDIEGRLRAYGAADSGMKLCPVINEFAEVSEYESYVNMLIAETRKDMSISMEDLGQLKMAYKLDSDGPLLEMPFVHFVFNMIMWRPYIVTGIAVTEADIFAPKHFTNGAYKSFFDRFADNYKDQFTAAGLSEIYHDTQVFMNKLATAMGPLFGNSISIFDMLKMARRNKEVNDILNTHIDDNPDTFRVDEAEQFLRGQTDRLFDIMLEEMDDNNPLKPMIRAGVINKHQAQEVFVNVGFKPTLSGDTIPNVTNSSLMGDGLNTPQSAYVDAVGGRKASIMQMGVAEAGYFGRHINFATENVTLNEDPHYSCDTVNLYSTRIDSQADLTSYDGRFMKVGPKKFKVISAKDTHLIGKNVELRSPATCGVKDGKICKVCYGLLYNVNYGMHAGKFAGIDTNEAKTQLGLSARHALATNSAKVVLIDTYNILVNTNGWLFKLNPEIKESKYVIVMLRQDIKMESEEAYDKYDNYYMEKVTLRDKKTGEMIEIREETGMHLYLSKQMYNLLRDSQFFSIDSDEEECLIELKHVDANEPFFFLRVSNNELTKPIKQLTKFIQKGKKMLDGVSDYNEFIKVLNKLFRQGGIQTPSVHIEMIIRNLIRDKNNELDIPDWTVKQEPSNYRMVSMNDAAILSGSVIAGLMFEKVKQQLKNPLTYKKTKSSSYSLLFINE